MCVAAWAESATITPNSYRSPGLEVMIKHVSEILTYDFAARTVHIRLVLLPEIQTPDPVYLHFVHRRAVSISNDTPGILDVSQPAGQLIHSLGLLRNIHPSEDGASAVVRVEDGTEIEAFVPKHVPFGVDRYGDEVPRERSEVPFTSARFGPLEPRELPYALGLSLTIEGTTFDRLIAVVRNHVTRYLYSIEGPEIIVRDIEPLDLRGATADVQEPYRHVLARGIRDRGVRIQSYDIITCDSEVTDYVRLVSKLRQFRCRQRLSVGGRQCLVNSWHSIGSDFLIQRVSFNSA